MSYHQTNRSVYAFPTASKCQFFLVESKSNDNFFLSGSYNKTEHICIVSKYDCTLTSTADTVFCRWATKFAGFYYRAGNLL